MGRYSAIGALVRGISGLVLLWGLIMIGYGVYLAIKFSGSPVLFGAVLGLGSVNTIFSGWLLVR